MRYALGHYYREGLGVQKLSYNEIGLLLSLGENLAYFQPPVPKCEGAMVDNCVNCREMVQRWYDEVKNYDFDKGGPKSRSGPYKHFSQMIWANSAELGVGTAVSKRYGFITVARYRPSGNEGDFAEFIKNVPPEGGTRKFFSNQLITSYFTFIRVHQPDIADLFLSVKALLYAPAQQNTCWSCWP